MTYVLSDACLSPKLYLNVKSNDIAISLVLISDKIMIMFFKNI